MSRLGPVEVSKCWKIVEFSKILIKTKNCKKFCKVQTASRLKEVIHPPLLNLNPHQIKPYYMSVTNFSNRDIKKYTNICFQSASRVQFLGVKKYCSANIFSDTKQKHVYWKICKARNVFGSVAQVYYFQYQVSWGL